jgi:single-stranded DNA-binding protein
MHTVSGKITRAPKIQQGQNNSGAYTAFFFELSEYIKGYGQEEASYTNYSVAFFPKSQAAIDFHMQAIAEGAFVVVSCDKLKIDISNPEYPKLKMENARLDGFMNPNQAQQAPQQGYQQPRQQPQQAPAPQYNQAPPQRAPQPTPQHRPQQSPAQQRAPQYPDASQDFNDDLPPF